LNRAAVFLFDFIGRVYPEARRTPEDDYKLPDKIQDELMKELKDIDGYLNIGRQTASGEREIYFACTDFRKPSKIFLESQHRR
jgi:hypothetical protein